METRNATVTKTSFSSYNVVTCAMKDCAQCQLEPALQAFFCFNLVFPPSFPFPTISSTRIVGLKKKNLCLEPRKIKTESVY